MFLRGSRLQEAFDSSLHLFLRSTWTEEKDLVSFTVHQELGEVPRHLFCQARLWIVERTLATQETEKLGGAAAIDIGFREERELGLVTLPGLLFDFWVGAWLLAVELVAGLGNDFETWLSKLRVHPIEEVVVLLSQASLGGNIDD